MKYQDDVRICLDLFGQTKYDGKVIGIIFSEFLCFKTVEMWSEACGPKIQEISRFYINTQRIKALKQMNAGDTKVTGGEELVEQASTNVANRKLSNCSMINE